LLSNLNIPTKSIGRAAGLALLFLSLNLKAQNLVYNPGFEEYSSCPEGVQFNNCTGWFNPMNPQDQQNIPSVYTTPDIYNTCTSNQPVIFSVPSNWVGFQYPLTGNSYAGIYVGQKSAIPDSADLLRDYTEGTLISPLISGKTYCVSWYVSKADNWPGLYSDRIGAYFSVDSLIFKPTIITGLYLTPHIENPENNFITDTTKWIKISGIYTAQGGERFITIGNFYNQANTHYIINDPNNTVAVYLYVDNVTVEECEVGIEETPTPPTYLYPNPTTNTVTLSYTFKQATTIEVYSINGACLLKQPIQAGTQNPIVDVSNLANGLYVVRAYTTTQPLFNQRLAIVK
jgi:hypothetical protein